MQGTEPFISAWSQGPNAFELIAVGDDGSTGNQSVGFTTNVISDQNNPATWADWICRPITVVPAETLLLRFRYKMTSDAATPEGEVQVDSRGFTGVDTAGNPVNYVGGGGFLLLSSTEGAWTSAEKQLLVPAGATRLDLRVNQIFTNFTTLPWQGSFRMDDFQLFRQVTLQADFDESNSITAADLAIWKQNFPTATGATKSIGDADNNGAVDGSDFLLWQREVGKGMLAAGSIAAVPEPASATLIAAALIAVCRCERGMRRRRT